MAWKTLINQHVTTGCIWPLSSPYASPFFIIPKAGPTVLSHWVVDYHLLNRVTIPDAFPLSCIDDILADCAKGKIWGEINMTNLFFQMCSAGTCQIYSNTHFFWPLGMDHYADGML